MQKEEKKTQNKERTELQILASAPPPSMFLIAPNKLVIMKRVVQKKEISQPILNLPQPLPNLPKPKKINSK